MTCHLCIWRELLKSEHNLDASINFSLLNYWATELILLLLEHFQWFVKVSCPCQSLAKSSRDALNIRFCQFQQYKNGNLPQFSGTTTILNYRSGDKSYAVKRLKVKERHVLPSCNTSLVRSNLMNILGSFKYQLIQGGPNFFGITSFVVSRNSIACLSMSILGTN